jgi:sugar lactone lactonase YvrE
MKKYFSLPLAASVILAVFVSCSDKQVTSETAYTLKEKDLIPEGITYDAVTKQIFVSSIGREKILAVAEDGTESDFASPRQDSIFQTLGMKVDAAKRRLWVVSNNTVDNLTYSAVHVFNIDSRKTEKKVIVADTVKHLFNDIALNSIGDAYVTDSYGSSLYKFSYETGKLELFAGPDSLLRGVNGLVVSPDDRIIFAATSAGISLVDTETRTISRIGDPSGAGSGGIDGLVYYNGSLIGVMNSKDSESEMFVARYLLSPDLKEITQRIILDKGNPLFNLPTTCTLRGDELYYLGNTSLRLYFQDKTNSKGLFMNPLILKIKLSD